MRSSVIPVGPPSLSGWCLLGWMAPADSKPQRRGAAGVGGVEPSHCPPQCHSVPGSLLGSRGLPAPPRLPLRTRGPKEHSPPTPPRGRLSWSQGLFSVSAMTRRPVPNKIQKWILGQVRKTRNILRAPLSVGLSGRGCPARGVGGRSGPLHLAAPLLPREAACTRTDRSCRQHTRPAGLRAELRGCPAGGAIGTWPKARPP